MISYFFRFVSLSAIMQVGGGGEHVNKADAMRGAVGACQQAGLAGQECGHRGRDVDTGRHGKS